MWSSALFEPGRMGEKTKLFLNESRMAHDRITNLLILTHPLLIGVWQFRETAKYFAHLAEPVAVKDAVLSYIQFPSRETAVKRLDFNESVTKISWDRQRDATGEMMFLVGCSIFENFTSHLQDLVSEKLNLRMRDRPIEKGLQFPTYTYDLTRSPPVRLEGTFEKDLTDALEFLQPRGFLASKLCPAFPMRDSRNMIEDLEMKLQTYLLFKKLRNTIAHGRFDETIPTQYKIVQEIVTHAHQGQPVKVSVSRSNQGRYYLSHHNVIGFIMLLLSMIRDIDFLYLISKLGEKDVVTRLSSTKDSKQFASSDRKKEVIRLRLSLSGVGVRDFAVDEETIKFFIAQGAWRP